MSRRHKKARLQVEPAYLSPEKQAKERPEQDGAPNVAGFEHMQAIWDAFREEHYEAIEQLPLSLHRMFTLLRELDGQYQDHLVQLQDTIREYSCLRETLEASSEATRDSQNDSSPPIDGDTRTLLHRIAHINLEVIRIAEEKFALSRSAYDAVDRHVRSLDSSVRSQEASLALGIRSGTSLTLQASDQGLDSYTSMPNPRGALTGGGRRDHKRKRDRKGGRKATSESVPPDGETALNGESADGEAAGNIDIPSSSTVMNMKIDPNEPRYCYCEQVSYGEMVGCDGEECEREWFHYGCAGLTEAPKNKWYCTYCKPPETTRRRR